VALKMGITERERRVEAFFYGRFMDEELLRGKGLEPEGGEIAAIDGFALRRSLRLKLKTEERRLGNSLGISALRHRKVGAIHLSS
jgi:hypothetical protein